MEIEAADAATIYLFLVPLGHQLSQEPKGKYLKPAQFLFLLS